MAEFPSVELRNTCKKTSEEFRKDPLDYETFKTRWCKALRRASPDWEGPRAVNELMRKQQYEFLACEGRCMANGDWLPSTELLQRIVEELRECRTEAAHRLIKDEVKDLRDFLCSTDAKIGKKQQGTRNQELKFKLEELRKSVRRTQKHLRNFEKRKRPRFSAYELFWPELPRNDFLRRRTELHTRLQVQLGKLLAVFLRRSGVSLESIARLIALAYRVGQVCEPEKIPSVRNIRENLRDAGLHKAASFQRDAAGTWCLSTTGPGLNSEETMRVTQLPQYIYGTITIKGIEKPFSGWVKARSVRFWVERDVPKRGRTLLEYRGTVERNEMSGEIKLGDSFRDETERVKRVKGHELVVQDERHSKYRWAAVRQRSDIGTAKGKPDRAKISNSVEA